MKSFKTIVLSLFLLAMLSATGFLVFMLKKDPEGMRKTAAGLLDKGIQNLESLGLPVRNQRFDATIGECIFVAVSADTGRLVEIPGEAFPYSYAVKLVKNVAALCNFVSSGIAHKLSPVSEASFSIHREPGKPLIVEPLSGGVYISSKKLATIVRTPHMDLHFTSAAGTNLVLTMEKDKTVIGVFNGDAKVSLVSRQSRGSGLYRPVELNAAAKSTLLVDETTKLEAGHSGVVLPAGFKLSPPPPSTAAPQ